MTQQPFKVFLVLLFIASFSANAWAFDKPLPEACTATCVTPYGAVLGTTAEGIKAYSNCQSSCVVFSSWPNPRSIR